MGDLVCYMSLIIIYILCQHINMMKGWQWKMLCNEVSYSNEMNFAFNRFQTELLIPSCTMLSRALMMHEIMGPSCFLFCLQKKLKVKQVILNFYADFALLVITDRWDCAQLLVEQGANLNKTDCHFGTPLHAAVHKGSIESAKVLLKAGELTHLCLVSQKKRPW